MFELEQAAFVLHSRPYRENQKIVELLTAHHGKVSAITYVGHTNKSNKKSLLQPFLPISVVLSGNNSLQKLTRVEAIGKSYSLEKERLYSGFYLNELLVRLLPEHQESSELFSLYQQSLSALNGEQAIELVLRTFEAQLLEELGQTIDFSLLDESKADFFHYIPDNGFQLTCDINKHLPKYTRSDLQAIATGEFTEPQVRQSYKKLMRQVINHLLGGKPLNSRQLFK
ncbi:DNA repair protein RecO [Thalassotalea piscium]|uniref:DNA repair protein RecO n=1 Tax=Thalassotalea piscium TaxID=1230533 RepID=A0A7X0NFV1_9GAMM|nr:DNA repair protein RecO [Thalassotalea piscium]MBB6542694.1 DNA repair protein RecO (recombination protein O) [Thalassotalea piscium]